MEYFSEPAREVPVVADVDVAVAGGGIAGCTAAMSAAKMGARTLVVERFGQLGGNMGPGMWAGGSLHLALRGNEDDHETLLNRQGMGGVPEEIVRRALSFRVDEDQLREDAKHHYNVQGRRLGSDYLRDSQSVSYVILKMMVEMGVEVLLSSYVTDPILTDGAVSGFLVENKSGRTAVRAAVTIDATGDADLARRAGIPTRRSPGDPGIGLFYAVGDVDWDAYKQGLRKIDAAENEWMRSVMNAELGYATHGLEDLVPYARRAWVSGGYRIVQRIDSFGRVVTRCLRGPIHGLAISRAETSGKIDPGDASQVSAIEGRIREYIFETVQFLRGFVPGFGNCYLHTVAPFLGARGGRWIDALYPISGEDGVEHRKFDDVLYVYHDGRAGTSIEVPFRALVPKDIDGLIAAGRSAVPRSPNFRARYSMLLMGQAAGVAAAFCARNKVQPRRLDPRIVQRQLLEWGSPIVESERLIVIGLG